MSRTKVEVVNCDFCGNEINGEVPMEGRVYVNDKEEIRFDICAEDVTKYLGEMPTHPTRRKPRQPVEAE